MGALFCDACQAQIDTIGIAACPHCGAALANTAQSLPACPNCGSAGALNGILAAGAFAGPLRAAIHRFKYDGWRDLAEPLAARLVAAWCASPLPGDVVIPVPLYPAREAERGYNQSALLAAAFAAAAGLACLPAALARQRETLPQVGMNRLERQRNVLGAFTCCQPLSDRQVLLVDDVCTTGATLSAAAAALRAAGASRVWGLVVARAGHGADGTTPS